MKKIYFVLLVILLSLNLRPAITAVGPLLMIIKTELAMTSLTASLITTIPVFCMGLFAPLAVKLSRRWSVETALFFAMALLFSALVIRFKLHSSLLLIFTALLAGMGIGMAGPLIAGLIKKHYLTSHYLMSFYSVSMVCGAALASSLAIPLYRRFNDNWQSPLGIWSLLALIAALALLPLLKATPKAQVTANIESPQRKNWWLMLFFSLMAAIFYSLTAWLAPFAQSLGFNPQSAGLLLTLFTMIQIPVSFLIPWLVSRQQKQRFWLLVCSFSELTGIILLLCHVSPWIVTIFLGLGAGGLFPLALMLPLSHSRNASEVITLSAFMQSGGFMIGALGPLLFGFTIDLFNNFYLSFALVALLILGMIASILKLTSQPT